MPRVNDATSEPVVTEELVYPQISPDGKTQWLSITDDYLVVSKLLQNIVVFNASSPHKGPPSEHLWEILAIGRKKQLINGFKFGELMVILENNPNCCR